MKIISFAWTTSALIEERKTVTRRECKEGDYYGRFEKGDVLQAFNRSPRFKGEPVGYIVLLEKPYKEKLSSMPDDDYEGEGFGFYDENPELVPKYWRKTFKDYGISSFRQWFRLMKRSNLEMWVLRFEFYPYLPAAMKGEDQAEFDRLVAKNVQLFMDLRDAHKTESMVEKMVGS